MSYVFERYFQYTENRDIYFNHSVFVVNYSLLPFCLVPSASDDSVSCYVWKIEAAKLCIPAECDMKRYDVPVVSHVLTERL